VTARSLPATRIALLAANSAWNILNFRRPLVEALLAAGWRVIALAPEDGHGPAIRSLGVEFVPISIDSSGTSLLRDTRLFIAYWRILRALRPHAFLGFTAKPNIYGSFAARLLGIPTINNISGLGTAFMRPGPLNRLVGLLYRVALHRSARVFFQNPHDMALFLDRGLVRPDQAKLIPGSGIDLDRFKPVERPGRPGKQFRFLFVGRLLRDKGLVEYAEAARLLRTRWPNVEFAVLGFAGSNNPSAVPITEVERWQAEGTVTYLGDTDDVRPFLAECGCVVLPSYREGLPRSLLEAAAMARPMVATDVPGCREVVSDKETGFLCEVRSAPALATAMEAMLALEPADRDAMGLRARNKVEKEFDEALVVQAYMEALK
jgi:glycosyltransferase involved in cell wall biosynthesis